jgi:hypothetical protein
MTTATRTLAIDGADLHVEERGHGDPLLLLHGMKLPERLAEETIDLAFTPEQLATIAARTLIVSGDRGRR